MAKSASDDGMLRTDVIGFRGADNRGSRAERADSVVDSCRRAWCGFSRRIGCDNAESKRIE